MPLTAQPEPIVPEPIVNADSQSYWAAAAQERLVLRQCNDCNAIHFMPRFLCPECWSENLTWIDASGRGTVHSYSIIRRASDPAFKDRCPYVVALIDLEEGPRMMTNILGEDALCVQIGDAVSLTFENRGATAKLPQFKRAVQPQVQK